MKNNLYNTIDKKDLWRLKYRIVHSLTPVAAKVFEYLEIKWVDKAIEADIDAKKIGGISGISIIELL